MLSIKNLTKLFGDKKIIDAVSLDIPQGKVAVLLGESGVGKSTLLRILNNLETIDTGTLTLNGKTLDPKTIHKEHTVGMVFQNFNLFDHLTVLENITLSLEKVVGKSKQESEKIALDLLKKYGLSDKINKYPTQLSGGQKQRVALVRSLALKPKIICLDEPTSALDPLLTAAVGTIIHELAQEGLIVLVATHDTSLLEKLPCTIHLMHGGKIIESAQSQELFTQRKSFPKIDAFIRGMAH
ncbi:MAG: ATP-binding cassette domain-containing protein [Candidatus Babeliales bacterium]